MAESDLLGVSDSSRQIAGFSSRIGGLLVVVGFCVFGCRVLVLVLCGGSDACAGLWVGTNICNPGVWPDLLCGVSEVSS